MFRAESDLDVLWESPLGECYEASHQSGPESKGNVGEYR